MPRFQNYFKNFDLFPLPIDLRFKGKNEYKTIYGAFITFAITVIVIVYLAIQLTEMRQLSISTYTTN